MKVDMVQDKEEIAHHLNEGVLQNLYSSCFSDPPYEEVFSDNEIAGYFFEYFEKGIVCFCHEGEMVVGFAAAVPLECDQEIARISEGKNINKSKTWYYADLGVSKDFRRRGIAEKMSRFIVNAVPEDQNILMRTQENNKASLNCHKKIGYKILEGMTQDIKRANGNRDHRVFLLYSREECGNG